MMRSCPIRRCGSAAAKQHERDDQRICVRRGANQWWEGLAQALRFGTPAGLVQSLPAIS